MANHASRGDLDTLIASVNRLELHQPVTTEWSASPFAWLLDLPSGTRGAVGRRLIEEWINSMGVPVHQETANNQRYVVVNGHRVQVKMSTLWNNGTYRFQQIRDQDYEYVLCLGLSPDDVHAWFIPKNELFVHLRGTAGQHTGAGARETFWLTTSPSGSEGWLDDHGNQLSTVRETIMSLA
jgi:hypothetical protein